MYEADKLQLNKEEEEMHTAKLCPNRMGLYSGSERKRKKKKDCNQHPI